MTSSALYLERGSTTQGNYLWSFNLIPISWHLRWKRWQKGALNPMFHCKTMSVRDTFLESCQERVTNLVQVCGFFTDISYPPKPQTPALYWDPVLDCCWSKTSFICIPLSQILPPTLSLKSSWPKFTCGNPSWNISGRIAVQTFTQ